MIFCHITRSEAFYLAKLTKETDKDRDKTTIAIKFA